MPICYFFLEVPLNEFCILVFFVIQSHQLLQTDQLVFIVFVLVLDHLYLNLLSVQLSLLC
jgi:hypothetical protein